MLAGFLSIIIEGVIIFGSFEKVLEAADRGQRLVYDDFRHVILNIFKMLIISSKPAGKSPFDFDSIRESATVSGVLFLEAHLEFGVTFSAPPSLTYKGTVFGF